MTRTNDRLARTEALAKKSADAVTVQAKANVASAVGQIMVHGCNQADSLDLLYKKQQTNKSKSLQWCVEEIINELPMDRQ